MTSPSPAGLRERIARLLDRVERPARYVDGEWNAHRSADADYRVALVYPDTYELGMANQALGILYALLGSIEGVACERAFVPWKDMAALLREEGIPLFTLESRTPLSDVDLIGVTLPYELSYTNVLEVLDLSGAPLRSAERGGSDPLVIGGGPCAYNPEPVAPFFDAILLGEGEEAAAEIVAAHRACLSEGRSRPETLRVLSDVPGVYVPSLYSVRRGAEGSFEGTEPLEGVPATVAKRLMADLDDVRAVTCPVVPYMDVVHDRSTIEVLRGCTRGCRFCQAGMVYRPVRERSADVIVRDVVATLECTGYEEVSLTSLSSADHSCIDDVARRLARRFAGKAVTLSLPSSRVDAFGVDLARTIASGRKGGLTFAPEAGTQRLRDVVNKNVTEEDLLDTVRRVFEAGWRRVKLYFMIGLPTETDEDVREIGRVVGDVLRAAREATPERQRGSVRVNVSVSTFVPKAHTPFQWEPQLTLDEVAHRQSVLRDAMPVKGVQLSWHDARTSFLEGVFARGGRELADVVETAWRGGAAFSAWTEEFDMATWTAAFAQTAVDPTVIASGERTPGVALPWGHLSSGVTEAFLARERERAFEGETTPDCSFGPCASCGVCSDLGVDVVVRGERRG